jgi:hypothetical protein
MVELISERYRILSDGMTIVFEEELFSSGFGRPGCRSMEVWLFN